MTAPTRPPSYCDAIIDPNVDVDPAVAVPWLIELLVSRAETFPDWLIEQGSVPVTVKVAGPAAIAFEALGVRGTVGLSFDPSGWLAAVVRVADREVFRCYVERRYEAYEVWPPGAGEATGDPPGTFGKHLAWVSVALTGWPAIAPLAQGDDAVTISIDESKL